MVRAPPRTNRTDTVFPSTTRFRSRLARKPPRLQHRTRQRRLARAKITRQQQHVAGPQHRADRGADAVGLGKVMVAAIVAHARRGRVIRTSVPCTFSLITSIVPPCAATSWRARARPMPPVAVPACCPSVTAATASGMPGPLSDTTISTPPAPPSAWSSTRPPERRVRSEEHTSELQSLMRLSYALFCLNKKKTHTL